MTNVTNSGAAASAPPRQNWFDLTKPKETPNPRQTATDPTQDPVQTKSMFLKLLIAQIQNQNPLNPSDGTEYLAQLSQFTGVEQMLEMRKELQAIREVLTAPPPGTGSSSGS